MKTQIPVEGVPTLATCSECKETHLTYAPHECGVCPGPCSQCEGLSHHWMEYQDENNDELFYWHCKHCSHKVLYDGADHPWECDCPDCSEGDYEDTYGE